MIKMLLLHIPFAIELPIKINITGDPQKDAQYLLMGIAGCVLLLIITIIALIILAFRKKKKKKKAAEIEILSNSESNIIVPQETKSSDITTANTTVESLNTNPSIENKEVVKENTPVVKPQPEVKSEPKVEPKAEPKTEATPEKDLDPEDKMDEIRQRLAEIAQNRKTNPNDYQEIVLPKLTADFAKTVTKEDAGNSADSFEAHETEEIPNETEIAGNNYDYEEQIQNLNTDFKGEPISDSEYEKSNEEIIKASIENEVDDIFAKQELDTDFSGEPISDSNYSVENPNEENTVQVKEFETKSDSKSASTSNIHSDAEKLNAQFQNTQLPVKRMTFTEWMDNFK